MTTSEHSARIAAAALLDTVYELNEAHATGGSADALDLDRSRLSTKSNDESSTKRCRIPTVFSSRTHPNEKKATSTLTNAVGVLSPSTGSPSGPGGANQASVDSVEQGKVVAGLAQHTSTAMPVASCGLPPQGKFHVMNAAPPVSSSASSSKPFLSRRVRSQSKSDTQSTPEKSLFSRFFPKKPKKPLPALLTTTTQSIQLTGQNKRHPLVNQKSLTSSDPRSTIDEEQEDDDDDEDFDERKASTESLTDPSPKKGNAQRTSSTRANSGNSKSSNADPNPMISPASDSQYYASMSSAPKGFSISYHKCMTKGNDSLRKQVVYGRPQLNKPTGASPLMSMFQDPKRTGTQSPPPMTGTTRVKTYSGQTIVTRTNSNTDRPRTYSFRSSSMSPTHDTDETFISDEEIYTHFMKSHSCYDIMPKSSKLVIFDTQLAVKKAFFALVYNGVRAAPLWDTKRQKFVGMLTITDFILILQTYYKEPHAKIEELEEHRIETWRDVLKEYEKPLLCIRPTDSLFEAVRILLDNHVHRLPIVDPISNNVVFILTHKRILRFFYLYIYDWPQPAFMSKTLEELNVGTYDNMHIIGEETTIIEALNVFVKYRVSALPVVDKNRKLVNVYSKFDVIGLAADKTYRNLNMTINEALAFRKERAENVAKCYKHENLSTCMERIVKAEVHRLVVVDSEEHVIGVLSLSDLLNYIVMRPTKLDHSIPSGNASLPSPEGADDSVLN